jgi:predicted glutamine amidotransferase
MHNGLIRDFAQLRRDLLLGVDPTLIPQIEGSTDSELLFYLALTFGLEDDAVVALEQMAGFAEQVGEKHGVQAPLQMSVAVTDGERIVAARYSSEGRSRSLYFSTDARVLKEQYPEIEELQALSDEARAVVSEPLGDLVGAWNEVPESSIGIVQPGQDELRRFTPRHPSGRPRASDRARGGGSRRPARARPPAAQKGTRAR